jgi:hypothetical protein
MNFVIVAKLAV